MPCKTPDVIVKTLVESCKTDDVTVKTRDVTCITRDVAQQEQEDRLHFTASESRAGSTRAKARNIGEPSWFKVLSSFNV